MTERPERGHAGSATHGNGVGNGPALPSPPPLPAAPQPALPSPPSRHHFQVRKATGGFRREAAGRRALPARGAEGRRQLRGEGRSPRAEMLVHLWGFLYSSYFRFWLKWLWRLLTGKCELQRVFEGAKEGARRTLGIGKRGWGGRPRERVRSRGRADVTACVLTSPRGSCGLSEWCLRGSGRGRDRCLLLKPTRCCSLLSSRR